MKSAIYIEDGKLHFVATPENDQEMGALVDLRSKPVTTSLLAGPFRECMGAWVTLDANTLLLVTAGCLPEIRTRDLVP